MIFVEKGINANSLKTLALPRTKTSKKGTLRSKIRFQQNYYNNHFRKI